MKTITACLTALTCFCLFLAGWVNGVMIGIRVGERGQAEKNKKEMQDAFKRAFEKQPTYYNRPKGYTNTEKES